MDLNPIDDLTGALGDAVGSVSGAAGDAALGAVVEMLFRLVANAVTAITGALASAINESTVVDLNDGWFASERQQRLVALVLAMTAVLLVLFVLVAVVRSLIAGEPGEMVRAVLVEVPLAIFASVAVTSVTALLLAATDAASAVVIGDANSSLGELAATLGSQQTLANNGLLGILFGLLYVIAAVVVWIQLLVRAALLYLMVTLAPLGFAARVFPGGRAVARRTVELIVSLIVSKFAICVAFATGGAALHGDAPADAGPSADLRSMLVAAALMLLAAFMPWLVWRVIPVFEPATVTQGVDRAPMRTATSVVSAAVTASSAVRLARGAGEGESLDGPSGAPAGGAVLIDDAAHFAEVLARDLADDSDTL